jgi:hypothetical protein
MGARVPAAGGRTHSDHQALPPARLDALLVAVGEATEELGGAFEMPYGPCS